MLDFGHLPSSVGNADVQRFIGDSATVGQTWRPWYKPRGKSMMHIFALGQGGGGGWMQRWQRLAVSGWRLELAQKRGRGGGGSG